MQPHPYSAVSTLEIQNKSTNKTILLRQIINFLSSNSCMEAADMLLHNTSYATIEMMIRLTLAMTAMMMEKILNRREILFFILAVSVSPLLSDSTACCVKQ